MKALQQSRPKPCNSELMGERDKLQQMSSKLVIPLEKRTWDCKMLTQTEVDAINKQISDTKIQFCCNKKVDAEPDCQKNN